MTKRIASGWGLVTSTETGEILDTWFPKPTLDVQAPEIPGLAQLAKVDGIRQVISRVEFITVDLDQDPDSVPDAYLRLHLLSHRLVKPREINLTGIFSVLPNVVWTSAGPCAVANFDEIRLALRAEFGQLTVYGVDKFPRMVDYVVPDGVRIADADRVRLGAYLSPGTTVMHEGFINFNAGTLGASMVEGRISAGVIVGDGTDIGGGASIMGTLSGGGKEQITIGERCLLGAEAGVGISLGDDCTVEAGLYLTAGTKVTLDDGSEVKAATLSGKPNLLYIRDSRTGRVHGKNRSGNGISLNSELHKN